MTPFGRFLRVVEKILLSGLLVCFFPLLGAAADPGNQVPTVAVLTVSEQDVVPAREYIGHVEAIQSVELLARVEGFIEKVHFAEGDYIQAGEVLYTIEQERYRARVQADKAQIAQAQAELARAESHLKRLQAARRESISATDLDNAVAAELAARASLAAAQAALELSQLDLTYTTVKAPISGRIGKTNYTRGNLISPDSEVLATIVQEDPVRVVYSVSENDVDCIQKSLEEMDNPQQQTLSPSLLMANGTPFPERGKISFVDNQVDPSTGTIAVRAEFANPRALLIPGQYVTVQVKAAEPRLMPVVPQAAVLVNKDGRYVLKVDDETATVQPVTIGPAVDTLWAIESGLKPGDRVIVSGIQKVRPGQKVNAVPAEKLEN